MNMKKVMENIIFIAALFLIFSRFISLVSNVPFPLSVVVSNSMGPVLHKGDVVIWTPCSIDNVRRGDIVIYKSVYGHVIIHRVVEIEKRGLITKGDANRYTDQNGPHLPEPPINKNLYGKAIVVGSHPIKISYIGYIWLASQQLLNKIAKPATWGRPQPAIHFLIFLPMILFFAIFLILFILWLPNGKKLEELIFGVEKEKAAKTFAYLMAMFIPFLLFSSMLSYDAVYVEKEKDVPIVNPSFLAVKAITFFEGNGSNGRIFLLKSGEEKIVRVQPKSTLYIYSSPYWVIFPDTIIRIFYGSATLCIATLSLISAVILSIISFLILATISFIMDWMARIRTNASFYLLHYHEKLVNLYRIFSPIKNIEFKKSLWIMENKATYLWLIYLAFIPLLIDGISNLFVISFIAAIAMAIISYALKCRLKNEVAFLAMMESFLFSSVFILKLIVLLNAKNLLLWIEFISLAFILFFLIFSIAFITIFFIMKAIHLIRAKIDPIALTEVIDI